VSAKTKIYDRQPGETAKAFAAFVIYRDLGTQRSLELVSQKLNKSKNLMARWSTLNNWTERVAEYDADRQRAADAATDEALKRHATRRAAQQMKFRDDQVKLGRELIKKGRAMLVQPLTVQTVVEEIVVTPEMVGQKIAKVTNVHPTRWTTDGAGRMVEAGSKMMANGLQLTTGESEGPALAPQQQGVQVQIYLPEKRAQPTVVQRDVTVTNGNGEPHEAT